MLHTTTFIVSIFDMLAASCVLCSCVENANHQPVRREKIRVLIVDGFSNHDWQQTTLLTKSILESSGLFSIDVSTAPPTQTSSGWDSWRPPFAEYDVVVQNCNSHGGRPTWPIEVQHDLEAFVANGGGLYILHSANNAFPQWEEYNRMIGLGWRKRDFGWAVSVAPDGTIKRISPGQGDDTSHGRRFDAVLTRLGEHPIHTNLPNRWKAADLEVYRYARGPAENLTVLSYAFDSDTGLNFPTEWTVHYGEGRVYNSTFGHVWDGDTNPPGMRCVAFQTLLIRAVEWVSGKGVTWSAPSNFPDCTNFQLKQADS